MMNIEYLGINTYSGNNGNNITAPTYKIQGKVYDNFMKKLFSQGSHKKRVMFALDYNIISFRLNIHGYAGIIYVTDDFDPDLFVLQVA